VRLPTASTRRTPFLAALGFCAALLAVMTPTRAPAQPPAKAAAPEWVQRSNENTQVLLALLARFAPEGAAELGIPGLDEQIFDLTAGFLDRQTAAVKEATGVLKGRLETEKDPAVRQDLEILIQAAEENIRGTELNLKYNLPYFNVTETVFQGLRSLLDDQVGPERRAKALVRLRRYAGEEKGYSPLAELAVARIRERLTVAGLRGPLKEEVEKDLANSATFADGIGKLFAKYQIKGYEKTHAALKKQLAAYDDFVRKEILPRARTDFRQPQELYAYNLERFGVDMPVDELQSRAKASFRDIQNQMQALAPLVAKEKGFTATGYRDVLGALKKQQLVGKAILPHYESRIRDVEALIRREGIVTLPARDMRVQLASEAESAALPAPNMRPPRMIGNTGEMGTFVLPLKVPGAPGEEKKQFDDFTFEAASWTLTAHEGRPGHELQFSAVVEKGVSLARAIFAMNSVNTEGWALYAEAELQPYEPLEGQFVALQHRLMRSARAFLDPGLQLGTVSKEEAFRVLREDVGLSDAMATQEVERYTWRMPGQATSYFVGYNRLLETRADAERKLGPRFDRKRFNDFVLSQGMVPPRLLRKAVMEEFVVSLDQKTAR
jgi:hypothetical protein